MLRGLPDHAKRLAEWAEKNGWTGCVRKSQVEWTHPCIKGRVVTSLTAKYARTSLNERTRLKRRMVEANLRVIS